MNEGGTRHNPQRKTLYECQTKYLFYKQNQSKPAVISK